DVATLVHQLVRLDGRVMVLHVDHVAQGEGPVVDAVETGEPGHDPDVPVRDRATVDTLEERAFVLGQRTLVVLQAHQRLEIRENLREDQDHGAGHSVADVGQTLEYRSRRCSGVPGEKAAEGTADDSYDASDDVADGIE